MKYPRILFLCAWVMSSHIERESVDISLPRSEEHTSELQSHSDLVCRLLLEKRTTKVLTPVRQHARMHTSALKEEALQTLGGCTVGTVLVTDDYTALRIIIHETLAVAPSPML